MFVICVVAVMRVFVLCLDGKLIVVQTAFARAVFPTLIDSLAPGLTPAETRGILAACQSAFKTRLLFLVLS